VKITIAGYGTIGHYLEQVFGRKHSIVPYDEPKHLGTPSDLVETDFVLICAPTPSLVGGQIDTSIVEAIVRRSSPRVAIVCESTLPIGATDRIIRSSAKPVVYVPEYAGEEPEHPYRNPLV
jgi:hypothetical protein